MLKIEKQGFFIFQVLKVPSWNIKKKLSLGLESSISWNIETFPEHFFFFFFIFFLAWKVFSLNFLFLGLESSISHNMRKAFSKKFHFLKYKKHLFLTKYKKAFQDGFFKKKCKKVFRESFWGLSPENVLSQCKLYY